MGIFNNISRYVDEEEFDINYFLSLLSSQGIHFDQNKNLDMGNKRIMRLAIHIIIQIVLIYNI